MVGGGGATLLGGGDDMVILYSRGGAGGGAGMAQAGSSARFAPSTGDGEEGSTWRRRPTGVGREAWLLGGGDNAEVVYSSPTRR